MHYLSECLLIKNENQYLLEHLNSNVQAGIEHFYIYDNNSDNCVEKFLSDYPELRKRCTIEIFPDTEHKQLDCYEHFLNSHRNDSVYCAFVDTDEMFDGDLLKEISNNGDVYEFRGLIHGCNNQAFYEDKSLKDRFFADKIYRWNYTKCIAKLDNLIKQYPHQSKCKKHDKIFVAPAFSQLHHYYYKSFEEFVWKIKRGTIQKNTVRWLNTFFQDNTLPDSEVKEVLDKYGIDLKFKTEKKK